MNRTTLRLLAALTFLVAACGGAAPADDPASVARGVMDALEAKDMEAVKSLACEASRDEIAASFDFSSLAGELGEDIDPQQVLDAMEFDTSGVTIGEATVTGDTATLDISGSMAITFDETKMREIMREVLSAQGIEATDAMLDLALTQLSSFAREIPLDSEDFTFVREDGAWKICE